MEVNFLTRLQAAEDEKREVKSRLDYLTRQIVMNDESAKINSGDEESNLDVATESQSESSDKWMGSEAISRGDSAFDIDVKEMIQVPKHRTCKLADILASSALDMKEKQLESAQRDCDQLYNDLKTATLRSETLEGQLI